MFKNLFLLHIVLVNSKFIYLGFNDTTGLEFVASAGTTNCASDSLSKYGDVQEHADRLFTSQLTNRRESTDSITEITLSTHAIEDENLIDESQAGFRHRGHTALSSTSPCETRVRLTPSLPSSQGAMWYSDNIPILNGFDTLFTFHISDHSKECLSVKDQYLSQSSYQTCYVHGGDGFSFVIQNAMNTTHSIGMNGGELGFGGIENSLAITFDTWPNMNKGEDNIGVDHISIHSNGKLSNSAHQNTLLGTPRVYPLADGKVHVVRIVYHNTLVPQYFHKLVASDNLLSYLKDNGEERRIGTLMVYIDEGIQKDDPILVLPINLSLLLDLVDDQAYVGFTASTGTYFEKHDILNWIYCDSNPCQTADITSFDYHQQSQYSSVSMRYNEPGAGYGGDSRLTRTFPNQNTDPDTTPIRMKKQYYAVGAIDGVSQDITSIEQIPPETLY